MAYAAAGKLSVVVKDEREFNEREQRARRAFLRSRQEQESQLLFDFPDDDDKETIWSPS
jgi:hypothetical protein